MVMIDVNIVGAVNNPDNGLKMNLHHGTTLTIIHGTTVQELLYRNYCTVYRTNPGLSDTISLTAVAVVISCQDSSHCKTLCTVLGTILNHHATVERAF